MARLPRIILPGQALHIIQRGNNRQACFFADDDYRYYLDCLQVASSHYGGQLHAYVLMTNHVHLLLTSAVQIYRSQTQAFRFLFYYATDIVTMGFCFVASHVNHRLIPHAKK